MPPCESPPLPYQPGSSTPRTRWFHLPTVAVAVGMVVPLHLVATFFCMLLGYSCCSTSANPEASRIAQLLSLPLVPLVRFLDPNEVGSIYLFVLNSLLWGLAIGCLLSLVRSWIQRPSEIPTSGATSEQ